MVVQPRSRVLFRLLADVKFCPLFPLLLAPPNKNNHPRLSPSCRLWYCFRWTFPDSTMNNRSIAHYRITDKLDTGGTGEDYRATDSKLKLLSSSCRNLVTFGISMKLLQLNPSLSPLFLSLRPLITKMFLLACVLKVPDIRTFYSKPDLDHQWLRPFGRLAKLCPTTQTTLLEPKLSPQIYPQANR